MLFIPKPLPYALICSGPRRSLISGEARYKMATVREIDPDELSEMA
jgi:hypothetical protein